ncbi:hypothetical protein ACIQOW_28960 [Kitasatospora sp. NPDC091335]|uniref:hypothetical protein n=1 Tax=Kitasatospora sp. NPDC091335 TaxID=3364085 RepID=UPI00380350DA
MNPFRALALPAAALLIGAGTVLAAAPAATAADSINCPPENSGGIETFTAHAGLVTLGPLRATATVRAADPAPDATSTLTATATATCTTVTSLLITC